MTRLADSARRHHQEPVSTHLAGFIRANRERIIDRWKDHALSRLSLSLESSQLINALPEFIDELVIVLQTPPERRPLLESAARHGRHRVTTGVDIGGLTEEMALVGETIVELASEDGIQLSAEETRRLIRAIGRGTAVSVTAYATMRDKELATQASRHFSFIAHEVRTPLNAARLAAQLLAAGDDRARHNKERLDRALSRVSDLVDNSLIDARLRGEPELLLGRVTAGSLVDSAYAEVCVQAEQREIDIRLEVEPFELDADRKLLVSALTNLLGNAIKFTPTHGTVTLRARAVEDRALFEVEDECGGLPEDLVPRLFRPFVQAGRDKSGFGLGLMIVKQSVEAHNGSTRVVNRPGRGCCFVIDLPRIQTRTPTEPSS